MCGIIGVFNDVESSVQSKVEHALETQKHRGPDFQDYKLLGFGSAIAHNRLSIVDVSSHSNQPMMSNSGRYSIVFNGEIYNYLELRDSLSNHYEFKTKGDTEVILASWEKWGSDCLNRFNGMFSFIMVDAESKNVYICRDRFGVKPMYYHQNAEGAIFIASEIKTLWALGAPKQPNFSVLSAYLKNGSYGDTDESFWSEIKQLPGGYMAKFNYGQTVPLKLEINRWYDFVGRVGNMNINQTIDEISKQFESLMTDSIKLRFRSDVPVGFNISGGLDSSALLAFVHQAFPDNNKIEAFTFYSGDNNYDELPWVEKMINKTGKKLNPCLLDKLELIDLIEKVQSFQDEPYGGFPTIAYSNLFRAARKKGIIVLLDGQGVDETLAGYDYYQTNSNFLVQGVTSSPTKSQCYLPEFLNQSKNFMVENPFDNDLQNKQYRDLFHTKIPRALRFNDRVSMMYSTELREPFLDYRLVEFGFAQHPEIKIQNGEGKWLLRQIVHSKVGKDIAFAPKRPLQTPQREWLGDDLRDYMNEQVELFKKHDFVNAKEVDLMWESYKNGNRDNSFFLWQWLNVNLMLKK